jgi:hypothetical protein
MFTRTLHSRAVAGAIAVAALCCAWLAAAPAQGETFGQIAAWGAPGTDPGDFFRPTLLGVDSSDNSVYVVDLSSDLTQFRLQKFSSGGTALASAAIDRAPDANNKKPLLDGIVVDAALHRVYLLQIRRDADGILAAEQIDVFSTQPDNGGTLVAPSDLPSGTLPVPDRTGADALDEPRGIALDSSTHDLVIPAYDPSGNIVIQRLSSAGVAGARYVDDAATSPFGQANGYSLLGGAAVAPDGTVYASIGSFQQPIFVNTLPAALDGISALLGTGIGPAVAENWKGYGVGSDASVTPAFGGLGAQLALSPDGQTLYWTEQVRQEDNSSGSPGDYTLRGFSLASSSTSVLYGGQQAGDNGHTAGVCEITDLGASIAPGSNGIVYVLDHGDWDADTPSFGARVIEFGPGGSGCPAPIASFTANSSSQDAITVQKGATVHFDASGSALGGGTPSELDWDLDGSGQFATHVTGSPADETLDHAFLQKGDFTVGLKLKLAGGSFGDPPVVTKTVHVVPGTPTASFSALPHAPAAGASVHFDAGGSIDPTGSPAAGPTHTLKTYHWSFGDGAQQDTTTATVDHAFANGSASAVNRTVALTVTSNDDVTSGSVSQQIAVQGQPVVTTPPPTTTTTTPPPPLPPAPGKLSLTGAKLAGTGTAALTLACAASPGPCKGSLTLSAIIAVKPKGKGAKAKAKRVTVGSASFSLAAGQRGKLLSIRLSGAAKALLRSAHKLKLTVSIKTRNSVGATSSASRTVTLVAPKPRRKQR